MQTADAQRHAGQFRRALEDGDFMQLWAIWSEVFPNLPGPKTPEQAQIVMHRARTEAASVAFARRAYSHAWLVERGMLSGLPDELKPKAERLYPRVVDAVGISVNMSKLVRRLLPGLDVEVQGAMADAVEELHADGADLADRPLVHKRIFAAREVTLKSLIGSTTLPKS